MAKYKFTQEQFDRISLLLKRRLEESRDEQKKTRAEIRRSGFYISHHFRSMGQIAGYYFHVVVLWVKLQATVLGVCWAIFLSL